MHCVQWSWPGKKPSLAEQLKQNSRDSTISAHMFLRSAVPFCLWFCAVCLFYCLFYFQLSQKFHILLEPSAPVDRRRRPAGWARPPNLPWMSCLSSSTTLHRCTSLDSISSIFMFNLSLSRSPYLLFLITLLYLSDSFFPVTCATYVNFH